MFHIYNMYVWYKHQKHVENVSFMNFSFPFVMISKSANSFLPIFKAIFSTNISSPENWLWMNTSNMSTYLIITFFASRHQFSFHNTYWIFKTYSEHILFIPSSYPSIFFWFNVFLVIKSKKEKNRIKKIVRQTKQYLQCLSKVDVKWIEIHFSYCNRMVITVI